MINRSYNVVFEYFREDGEEGYAATVPALPGCITWGRTMEEAKAAVAEAIQGYLEVLQEDGEPFPEDIDRVDLIQIEKIPVAMAI